VGDALVECFVISNTLMVCRSDDKIISETRFLRKKHHNFELAKMLFAMLENRQLIALLGRGI
jgi:hypothetical protein